MNAVITWFRAWPFGAGFCILGCFVAGPAYPQTAPSPSAQDMRQAQRALQRQNCPGDPPGNLASFDCSFTPRMRLVEFVSTSVTDQAVGGASFFGAFAYVGHRDPQDWGRGWNSLGRSVGSRYTQNLAKGAATYAVSAAMNADPRNVALASDPRVERQTPAGVGARVGHALLDWATVRQSQIDAKGRRWPNLPLWTSAAVSGIVGNAWLPTGLATPKSATVTAVSSLATALASSVYTEFSPEVGRVLGALFKRGRAPSPSTAGVRRTQ